MLVRYKIPAVVQALSIEVLIYPVEVKSAMDFPLLQPCLALQGLIVASPLVEAESKKLKKILAT
jgi:hypothetical protein